MRSPRRRSSQPKCALMSHRSLLRGSGASLMSSRWSAQHLVLTNGRTTRSFWVTEYRAAGHVVTSPHDRFVVRCRCDFDRLLCGGKRLYFANRLPTMGICWTSGVCGSPSRVPSTARLDHYGAACGDVLQRGSDDLAEAVVCRVRRSVSSVWLRGAGGGGERVRGRPGAWPIY